MTDGFTKLDHPCKNTCSGWRQGYDKGLSQMQEQADKIKVKLYKAIGALQGVQLCPDNFNREGLAKLIKELEL
jgi:hypothetical protein